MSQLAKYAGTCPKCNKPIAEKEHVIRKNTAGKWEHENCFNSNTVTPKPVKNEKTVKVTITADTAEQQAFNEIIEEEKRFSEHCVEKYNMDKIRDGAKIGMMFNNNKLDQRLKEYYEILEEMSKQ